MISKMKARREAILEKKRRGEKLDAGEIFSNMIYIGGIALVATAIVVWLGMSLMNKGSDISECIETSNSFTNVVDAGNDGTGNCIAGHAAEDGNSYKDSQSHVDRYGN